jgi:Uma2 family endonuclease
MVVTTKLPELALRSHDADWNRARWELLPDDGNRYEVIAGVLYMTTAPSNFHQWIIRLIFLGLYQQLDSNGLGATLWAPIGLFMPGCDPVQPDLLFIRAADLGMLRDQHIFGVPALLIEVLSPSNSRQDTEIKLAAYARAGVPEYWIARPAERDVIVHSDPDLATGRYRRVQHIPSDGELISPTLPFRATVASFFAGAPDTAI